MLALIAAVAISCKVEKTGRDTYKVVAPTPEAKAAGEKLKEEAKEAGEKIKQGAATAAQKTGSALEQAGNEIKEHTQAKTETTETTSTVSTSTGTKKDHRSKTTTYR